MLESSRPGTSRAAYLADGRAEQVYGGVTVYSCMAFAKMTQTGRRRQQHVGLAKGAEPGGPGDSVFPRTVERETKTESEIPRRRGGVSLSLRTSLEDAPCLLPSLCWYVATLSLYRVRYGYGFS